MLQVVAKILRHRRNHNGSYDVVILGEGTFAIETIGVSPLPNEYGGAACPPLAHGAVTFFGLEPPAAGAPTGAVAVGEGGGGAAREGSCVVM